MIRACVIGWPIKHSRSPIIHNHWIKHLGIEGSYEKQAVAPDDAPQFLASLKDHGFVGCNVTVPLKEIAFQTAQIKEPSAMAVGAANTLWLDDQDRLCAGNTDTYGFMTHLETSAPKWQGDNQSPVTILGAGGASRAIVYGFLKAGVKHIHIYNRTPQRAIELAKAFGENVEVKNWDQRQESPQQSAVIVNTTTIGMNATGSLDIDFKNANPNCVVCDIVYVPLETELLKNAKAKGLKTVDGLGMLLHQAVPGFEKWFGIRPQVTTELRDLVIKNLMAEQQES